MRLADNRRPPSEAGSLMLAILFAIVLTALIAAAAITAISAQQKTRHAQLFTQGQHAADAAFADALRFANQGGNLADYDGSSAATTRHSPPAGTDTVSQWEWFAVPTLDKPPGYAYDIRVTTRPGVLDLPVRRFAAHVVAIPVISASVEENTITYLQGEASAGAGFFADDHVLLSGNSRVDSYDSGQSSSPTLRSVVGTNGTMSFGKNVVVDRIELWNYASEPYADRCTGPGCAANITSYPVRLGADTTFIDDACATPPTPIRPWVASEHGGVLNAGPQCYSAVIFDVDTIVTASPSNPAKLYVTSNPDTALPGLKPAHGGVTVYPGVVVNVPNDHPPSTALLIYAKSGDVTLMTRNGSDTRVSWGLWAPFANCGGSAYPAPANGRLQVWGSMRCKTLAANADWLLHFDDQQRLLDRGGAMGKAWYMTSYQSDTRD